MFRI
ncbi:Protein of unknown function [Pyronema omphalodes CBS 100304]|jgi:hypothetical protein